MKIIDIGTLVGLISAFLSGIASVLKEKYKQYTDVISPEYSKFCRVLNFFLVSLALLFVIYSFYEDTKEVSTLEESIEQFVKNQNNGKGKTLSEITLQVKKLGYDETKLSIAITNLLRSGKLNQSLVTVYKINDLHGYQCLIFD